MEGVFFGRILDGHAWDEMLHVNDGMAVIRVLLTGCGLAGRARGRRSVI